MAKEEKVVVTAVGKFENSSIKKNKSVDAVFKFGFDERAKMVQCIMFIGQNVEIIIRKGSNKPKQLGIFHYNNMSIDRDGETTLKFNTMLDDANVDVLNEILSDDDSLVKVKMQAFVEMEDEEDGEEDEE